MPEAAPRWRAGTLFMIPAMLGDQEPEGEGGVEAKL
jgi:hypothetical protein